ncbi:hypothetical protein [Azospirillum palustre]
MRYGNVDSAPLTARYQYKPYECFHGKFIVRLLFELKRRLLNSSFIFIENYSKPS